MTFSRGAQAWDGVGGDAEGFGPGYLRFGAEPRSRSGAAAVCDAVAGGGDGEAAGGDGCGGESGAVQAGLGNRWSISETPKWYEDAKLGIFIHWGVYSVPAFTGVSGIRGSCDATNSPEFQTSCGETLRSRRRNLVTRILSPYSRRKNLTRKHGRNYSRRQA